jgi:AraC-like DNA-binding protein
MGRRAMDLRVKAVLEKLANDPSAGRSLEQLASSVNLSSSRLRHLIRAELGMSARAFLKKARMERARESRDRVG